MTYRHFRGNPLRRRTDPESRPAFRSCPVRCAPGISASRFAISHKKTFETIAAVLSRLLNGYAESVNEHRASNPLGGAAAQRQPLDSLPGKSRHALDGYPPQHALPSIEPTQVLVQSNSARSISANVRATSKGCTAMPSCLPIWVAEKMPRILVVPVAVSRSATKAC